MLGLWDNEQNFISILHFYNDSLVYEFSFYRSIITLYTVFAVVYNGIRKFTIITVIIYLYHDNIWYCYSAQL